MADVQLNLIYNDNGAQKQIDQLIRNLQSIETHKYNINIDTRSGREAAQQIQNFVNSLSEARNRVVSLNNSFNGRAIGISFNEAQAAVNRFSDRVSTIRSEIFNFYTTLAAKKRLGLFDSNDEEQVKSVSEKISYLSTQLKIAKESAAIAREQFEKIGTSIDVEGATESLNNLIKDYSEEFSDLAQRRVSEGQNEFWSGIQRTASAAIQSIKSLWSDLKNYLEAPLNLTGVSQFTSLVESLEGSLLLDQISSNITSGFSAGVERFDILQTFPKVMEQIGYSSDQTSAAMDRLYQSVLGLPTAFGDIVDATQYFALMLDDLDKATDLAIAANNAFVASGATSAQITSGMRQLQYIIEGTKLRSTQWYSLIRSMPLALREVGDALGYPDFASFTEALMDGSIASETLIDTLIDVGLHSEKLGGIVETMKTRVQAALDNVRNAAQRMGNTLLEALDVSLKKTGGKGLAENIKGVSGIIDHIAQIASDWISKNGDKIQALIDKFMSIDWSGFVSDFLDGLVEFASNGLDNLRDFVNEIGTLITTTKQFFNDVENSRFAAMFGLGGSALSGIISVVGGFAQIGAANTLMSTSGGSIGGAIISGLSSLFGSGIGITIAGIATAVAGIYAVVKASDEKEEYATEKLMKNPETKVLWRDLLRDYIIALEGSNPDLLYNIPNLTDLLYSYSQGAISLPEVTFQDGSPIFYGSSKKDALEQAKKYYQELQAEIYTDRYMEGIYEAEGLLLGDSLSVLLEDASDLWDKYEESAKEYLDKLDSIEIRRARIQEALNALEQEGPTWKTMGISDFSSIYGGSGGTGGKYFSEKIEEAFGGLYRVTLSDFVEVQGDFQDLLGQVNDKILEGINNAPEEERAALLEAWADYLSTVNPNDPTTWAQLTTMLDEGETGESLVDTWLKPTVTAEEVVSSNIDYVKEIRKGILEAAGEELDSEEENLLSEAEENSPLMEYVKKLTEFSENMTRNYLPAIKSGLISFSDSVISAIQVQVDRINSIPFTITPKVNVGPSVTPREGVAYATGGYLFAPMGTDTIPAMLTPGEYVQRRAAVEHFGRMFMDRINALDLRGALRSLSINGYATPYSNGGFIKSDNRSYRDNHAVVNQTFNNASGNYGFRRAGRFVRALG